MIGIIDTESQNLGSIENCLKFLKIKYRIITNPKQANDCYKIILPGVGSFDNGMKNLAKLGLIDVLNKKAKSIIKKSQPIYLKNI